VESRGDVAALIDREMGIATPIDPVVAA